MTAQVETARKLHRALLAASARGSVRVLDDGTWVVRVLKGLPRDGLSYPPADRADREQWLATLTDHLEEATGVRPDIETPEVDCDQWSNL